MKPATCGDVRQDVGRTEAFQTTTALLRRARRVADRWYDFQEVRFTRNELWMTLNRQRRRLGLPRFRVDLPEPPIFTFIEGPGGLPRLVHRPPVAGGAAEPSVACVIQNVDGAACLVVTGELDLAGVATFLGYLRRANDAHDNVIVDLSGLQYMDSAGINALLDAQRRFTQSGGRIVLAAPSLRIQRILRIVTLDEVIPVFPTVGEAVRYFHSGGLGAEKVGS